MKIVDKYIDLKSKLKDSKGSSRGFNKKSKIKSHISLRKECDIIESQIIQGILNYTLDFNSCYSKLFENKLNEFLDHNSSITRFRINHSISLSVGYNIHEQEKLISKFREICKKCWEDFIITSVERDELDDFCKSNKIDKLKQKQIEIDVYNEIVKNNIDINDVIRYYYINENLSIDNIKSILMEEYFLDINKDKISKYINEINNSLVGNDITRENSSNLLYTIQFHDTSVYVICVNSSINTNKEFEIGFNDEEPTSFKILLSKSYCERLSQDSIIDIITDGICYNAASNDLSRFLDLKPIVKETVRKYLSQ